MPIETVTFEGVPGGAAPGVPVHAIDASYARYLQDILLDEPEITRQRGPVRKLLNSPSPISSSSDPDRAFGLGGVFRPDGLYALAVLEGNDSVTRFRFLNDAYTATNGDFSFPHLFSDAGPYPIVDIKPAFGAGVLIGLSDKYGLAATKRSMGLWRGGNKPDYSTGTVTITHLSTAVTGSGTTWSTNVVPGMFLMWDTGGGNFQLIGVVKTVGSNTSLTLESNPLVGSTLSGVSYKLVSVRGLNPHISTGRITVSSTSTIVNGGGTKFADNGLGGGWSIWRQRDMRYIGSVSSVASNIQLTLTANATNGMTNERYVALLASQPYSLSTVPFGFLHDTWQGRQFYLNKNSMSNDVDQTLRVSFSEQVDLEAVDTAAIDGSFFDIPRARPGENGRAVIATTNSLLVIKEDETHGIFGNDPDNWTPRKVADDGTLSAMSVLPYKGGTIWAGKNGIYHYDGVQAENLVEKTLGTWYKKTVLHFDPETYRMWAMIEQDHYILFVESTTPPFGTRKGSVAVSPSRMTFVINLISGAVTFFTNVNLRGAVTTPASVNLGTLYLVEQVNGGATEVYVSDALGLFEDSVLDTLTCKGDTAGPSFYMESGRFDGGDGQRKKLFKQVQLHHRLSGVDLTLDVISGLDDAGTTSTSQFTNTGGTWVNKRIKFLKRKQHLGFRLYANAAKDGFNTPSSIGTLGIPAADLLVVGKETLKGGELSEIKFRFVFADSVQAVAVIYTDVNGTPGVLAAQSIPSTSIISNGWISFPFSPGTTILPATYHIGIHSPDGATSELTGEIGGGQGMTASTFSNWTSVAPATWPGTTAFDSDLRIHSEIIYVPKTVVLGPWAIGFKRQRIGKI